MGKSTNGVNRLSKSVRKLIEGVLSSGVSASVLAMTEGDFENWRAVLLCCKDEEDCRSVLEKREDISCSRGKGGDVSWRKVKNRLILAKVRGMTCPGESGINDVSWREAKNCPVLAKGKEMACPGEGKAIDGSCRGAKICPIQAKVKSCPVLAKVKKLSYPGESQK